MIGLGIFALGWALGILTRERLEDAGMIRSTWRNLYFGLLREREREQTP